jgi:hypothetical protein
MHFENYTCGCVDITELADVLYGTGSMGKVPIRLATESATSTEAFIYLGALDRARNEL